MSVRHEFDFDEVADLRDKLEELANQARMDALDSESFSAALERRLEQGHAPCVAIDTGGAAARDPPPEDESDVSSESEAAAHESPPEDESGVVSGQQSENNEGETASDESKDDTLASDEIDELSISEIRDQSETIKRLLARKSSLSVKDLDAIIRREKALLSQVRAMRKQLNV